MGGTDSIFCKCLILSNDTPMTARQHPEPDMT